MFCTQGLQQKERGRARCSKAGLALWKCIGRGMACRCIFDDVAPIRLVMLQLYRWKLPNATNYAKPFQEAPFDAEQNVASWFHYIIISWYHIISCYIYYQTSDYISLKMDNWLHLFNENTAAGLAPLAEDQGKTSTGRVQGCWHRKNNLQHVYYIIYHIDLRYLYSILES